MGKNNSANEGFIINPQQKLRITIHVPLTRKSPINIFLYSYWENRTKNTSFPSGNQHDLLCAIHTPCLQQVLANLEICMALSRIRTTFKNLFQ